MASFAIGLQQEGQGLLATYPVDGVLWVDGRVRSRIEHRQCVPVLPQVKLHICGAALMLILT